MILIKGFDLYIKCDKCGEEVNLWQCDEITPKAERKMSLDGWRIEGEGNQAKHFCRDCETAPAKRRTAALEMVRVGI